MPIFIFITCAIAELQSVEL